MVPIGFTLESWKDKQISGKWVGRNTTNWLGLDSPPPLLLFPPASFLWENFWSQIQISCPTILGRLSFLLTYTTHNISILLSWHAKKVLGQKNLNISIVGRQACLPASSFGMQRSNFKSFLRSIDKSNDYHHQGVDIKNRHQCVGKIVKKNKVSSVCSYNPIQAKKSFLWVTFLRGFQV